jgi:hypothetical protein
MLLKINPHVNDVHFWVYIHQPAQSAILLVISIIVTYNFIKKIVKFNLETFSIILFSYLAIFLMINYSEKEISIFAFFLSIFSNLIAFMKIKYTESQ